METYLIFSAGNKYSVETLDRLAVALIENNKIVDSYFSDIKYKDVFNEWYHENPEAIRPFEAWEFIKPFLEKANYYVCFNPAVHKTTMLNGFKIEGIELPDKPYLGISALAQARLPEVKPSIPGLIRHFDLLIEGDADYGLNQVLLCKEMLTEILAIREPSTVGGVIEDIKERGRVSAKKFFSSNLPDADLDGLLLITENDELKWEGKSIVLTGQFEGFPDKKQLKTTMQEMGVKVASSLSSKTDYLIMGERPGPSKVAKAKTLQEKGSGILGMTEAFLYDLM